MHVLGVQSSCRIPGYHKLDKHARLADIHNRPVATDDTHTVSNTWHARLVSLARSISKTGPTNYMHNYKHFTIHIDSRNFYIALSLYIRELTPHSDQRNAHQQLWKPTKTCSRRVKYTYPNYSGFGNIAETAHKQPRKTVTPKTSYS